MTPSKGVHSLIPETCGYVTLHGKREFVDIIKVIDLMQSLLGYPGGSNVIT